MDLVSHRPYMNNFVTNIYSFVKIYKLINVRFLISANNGTRLEIKTALLLSRSVLQNI